MAYERKSYVPFSARYTLNKEAGGGESPQSLAGIIKAVWRRREKGNDVVLLGAARHFAFMRSVLTIEKGRCTLTWTRDKFGMEW